ncbi:MAG: M23 family metallopeptidase [Bacteroidia bacterium]|nr:M23 family metallopeptidase [Bacteroidia bacterium]
MGKIFYLDDICGSLSMEKKKTKKKLREWARSRYRLVVMNDSTFEEKFSLRLTPLGLIILIGAISILMTTLVISLVAFTPLRAYIPGYAEDVTLNEKLILLQEKTDSLSLASREKDIYLNNIRLVLRGEIPADTMMNPKDTMIKYTDLRVVPSAEDSALRKQIEQEDKYSVTVGDDRSKNSIAGFFFFTPVKGTVTASFSTPESHFGVDVAAPENEAIKATLDGTVIFAGWSNETGHVIHIQHSNNLVSIYKHNSKLLKKAGQYVKAGEVIAIIGNSGEYTSGTHLHFELWYNGNALDPQDHMLFK